MIDEPYLTAEEAASRLGISRPTLAAIVESGRLPFVMVSPRKVFYRVTDVEALLSPTTKSK